MLWQTLGHLPNRVSCPRGSGFADFDPAVAVERLRKTGNGGCYVLALDDRADRLVVVRLNATEPRIAG